MTTTDGILAGLIHIGMDINSGCINPSLPHRLSVIVAQSRRQRFEKRLRDCRITRLVDQTLVGREGFEEFLAESSLQVRLQSGVADRM
jgi:hypothetical protein